MGWRGGQTASTINPPFAKAMPSRAVGTHRRGITIRTVGSRFIGASDIIRNIHEPLGGVQIYERQLVEGTITVPFQEARKVVDRLVTAAESVVYTPFAAVRFHWQRWRGTGCDPRGIFPRSGAFQAYCIRD